MRFRSVRAYPFGPFQDEVLDLAAGMNVVYGTNEAGKSTWHAALYAGLCGRRRAKGPLRKEEQWLADRHRPWSASGWKVRVVIELADMRIVELEHDLSVRTGVARDADLAGRDYTSEILEEGAPDGSRWLGLNRRSFLSTACVRQAQLTQIREDPDALRKGLQRAATAAEQEETAASALERLDRYRKDRVGSDRAPTKPLLTTRRQAQEAKQSIKAAVDKNGELGQRRREAAKLGNEAEEARRWVQAVQAGVVRRDAEAAARRFDDAACLSRLFPGGAPPDAADDASISERVGAAISEWDSRPPDADLADPPGPDTTELDRRLKDLQQRIRLDRAAAARARAAATMLRLREAESLGRLFPDGGPLYSEQDEQIAVTVAAAIGEWESRPSTIELAEPDGPSVTALEDAIANSRRRLRRDRAISAAGQARAAETGLRRAEALSEAFRHRPPLYTAAEANLDQEAAEALAAWEAQPLQREPAETPIATLDERLTQITDQIVQLPSTQVRHNFLWLAAALGSLLGAGLAYVTSLGLAGASAVVTLCGGSALWLAWRRERGNVGRTASLLADLEARRSTTEELLQNGRRLEEQRSKDQTQRQEAARRLREAAGAACIEADNDECRAQSLASWLENRRNERAEREKGMPRWIELQSLLGGDSIERLRARTHDQSQEAVRLAEEFEPDEIDQALSTSLTPDELAQRERDVEDEVDQLLEDLTERRSTGQRVQASRKDFDRARASVRTAAVAAGVSERNDEALAAGLLVWREERDRRLREREELIKQWNRLQQLTRGESLDELRAASNEESAKAAKAAQGLAPGELARVQEDGFTPDQLEERAQHAETEHERLGLQHRAQLGLEEQLRTARERYGRAAAAVNAAASDAKIPAQNDVEALVGALREWKERQDARLQQHRELREHWDQLQRLLGANSLEVLRADAERLKSGAVEATKGLDPGLLERACGQTLSEEAISRHDQRAREAERRFQEATGELVQFEKSVPSLADAEDALSAAQADEDRVIALAETLDHAAKFLRNAQERVHRTIAPQLRRSVQEWLPKVTANHYGKCWIDPASLEVEVAGTQGERRRAALLSRGTAEQVFLLVRLAMARHLTKSDESCPLLLDDALAGSDSERKRAILQTLLEVSASTQVILFTHEEDVRDWASAHLVGPNARLIELPPRTLAA